MTATPPRRWLSAWRTVFAIGSGTGIIMFSGMGLVTSSSPFGVAMFLCLVLCGCRLMLLPWRQRLPRTGRLLGLFILATVPLLVIVAWLQAPDPRLLGGYAVRPPCWSPLYHLPERDVVMLATRLLPLVDPGIDAATGARLRGWSDAIYVAMDADPAFNRSAPALHAAVADLLGSNGTGHRYRYAPPAAQSTILFAHGSGGNLAAYLKVWKGIADRLPCTVIAPTFGCGNWHHPGGITTLAAAAPDDTPLVVAGLSNGGIGATRFVYACPGRARAVVLISPVIETGIADGWEGAAAWQGMPVLILHGERDNRVAITRIRGHAAALRHAGAQVQLVVWPDADHFLWFSHPTAAGETIRAWLQPLLAQARAEPT